MHSISIYFIDARGHSRNVKLGIEIGGEDAALLLARQFPVREPEFHRRLGMCSVASWGGNTFEKDNSVLVIVGTPIPRQLVDMPRDVSHARELLSAWDGAFAAAYWNSRTEELVVATDFLGLFPLYIRRHTDGISLATQTQAFRNAEPDPMGWGGFIALGHTLGDTTLCQDSLRFPAGKVLTFDSSGTLVHERETWRYPKQIECADIDEILGSARECRDQYLDQPGAPDAQLLLSGGFDSRFIACLLSEAGLYPQAITVANKWGSAQVDGAIAEKVAKELGLPHRIRQADIAFYSSKAYLDYLASTDAGTPSLGLFISEVSQFIDTEKPTWEGLLPGYTLVNPRYPGGGFEEWIKSQGPQKDNDPWAAARYLFKPDFYQSMREGFLEAWRNETEKYRDDSHGVTEFCLRNRARNRASVNPLKAFNNDNAVYLLGASRRFIEASQVVPFHEKGGHQLYFRLFEHFARLKLIPFQTGIVLVASPESVRKLKWMEYKMKIYTWFMHRPRIVKSLHLPFPESLFLPSRFSDTALLSDYRDPLLRDDICVSNMEDLRLRKSVEKLYFHWVAWRQLHEGRLHEFFNFRSSK